MGWLATVFLLDAMIHRGQTLLAAMVMINTYLAPQLQ